MQPLPIMTGTPANRRFVIVVALDRSEYAEIVLEHAIDQASRHERPDLHFVTVVDKGANTEAARVTFSTLVLQGLDTMNKGSDWRSWLHVLEGIPDQEIGDFAGDISADLIVVGRFGASRRKGSTAEALLDVSPCAVLVVNLKQDTVTEPQCPACVAVRAETQAERLFCPEHSGDRSSLSLRVSSSMVTRGGSVW